MTMNFELHLFLKNIFISELVYKTWHFNTLNHTPLQSAGVIKHTEVPITFTSNALLNEVIFVLQEISQTCCFS